MITTSFSYIPPYRSLFLSLPATTISPDPVTQPTPKHNIVYIPYPPFDSPRPRVGTIVNGAGLSMNTLDILTLHGLHPSNMLDTGGKATAETIWESFRMVLSDTSVKVLFVNVFGGLTLCDVIAKGIVLAFKEVGIEVPVVVRLRGMREKEGWRILQESKLPIFAFDDLEDAVEKVKELVAKG
ncbi:succinyl-CoA synthetase-like protein [Choiromyces venosus 120613-1]|uniref:Succinyl-CoA synthetase-like protein n=1 Tax=Choiromyces venosus 120613-1 TaxID=1336337 RepID=A0A3N4JFC0_9PEZI|nr:succinyl-CoA synthetase-like protein [Choiromyces venosus 120613-1]